MILGQVGGVEVRLAPVVLVHAALGEHVAHAHALGHGGEDVVVRLALAERLDALLLEDDHAVVGLVVVVRDVARAVAELAHVPALEVGAGRQDDVGELGLALHPDGLVDDGAHAALAVRLHVAVGLLHRAEERAAVAPVHGDERVAGRRVLVLLHLALDRRAAEALAAPLEVLVHHRLGDAQARDGDALGGVVDVDRGVQPGAVRRTCGRAGGTPRPTSPGRRRCRPRRSRGRRTSSRTARPATCPRCCRPACRSPAWRPAPPWCAPTRCRWPSGRRRPSRRGRRRRA